MTRRRRTPAQREAICETHSWTCCICKGQITPPREKWILEHIIPLASGGADDESNLAPAHYVCAIEKTKNDLGRIAKGKRVRAKHVGSMLRSPRGFRGWRKFDGSVVLARDR